MISDETYKKLASIKGGKSFTELLSELVDRLKQTNTKEMMKFAGIINDREAEKLQKAVNNIRRRAKVRL